MGTYFKDGRLTKAERFILNVDCLGYRKLMILDIKRDLKEVLLNFHSVLIIAPLFFHHP
jgi:hypothetical protein